MVRHYYRNVHAVVFVYDVTNPISFDNLKKWIEESNQHSLGNVPKILVGNKCDGVTRITTNVAQTFADQNNMPVSVFLFKVKTINCKPCKTIWFINFIKQFYQTLYLYNHLNLSRPSC